MGEGNNRSNIFKGILIVQIMLMVDAFFMVFGMETSKSLSLLRYFFYFLGVIWIIKGIRDNHFKVPQIYKFFLCWVIIVILSALPKLLNPAQDYILFKSFISGKLFIYVLPFLICADLDASTIKSIFQLSFIMIICYLVLSIPMYFADIVSSTSEIGLSEYISFLMEGSILLLMTCSYHRKGTVVISAISVLIVIIIMMLLARRNKVVFYGGGLGFAIILNILNGRIKVGDKILIIVATIVCFTFLYKSGDMFELFYTKMATGMSSREEVIEDFVRDFNQSPNDWVFGRGFFGEFDGGNLNNSETGLRDIIENGYLQLILKGGGIWLVLLFLISVKSVYCGLFKSNNIFVKGCACLILLYYLDMVGYGIPVASIKYILVFISISVCSSSKWRTYSDEELKKLISL